MQSRGILVIACILSSPISLRAADMVVYGPIAGDPGKPVGTFVEDIVTTDKLGRRTGPRTRHSIEEKLRIVEETRARGASVATVARRHHINPNQVFAWRQLYRRGLLGPHAVKGDAKMLPVQVSTPTVLPSERVRLGCY